MASRIQEIKIEIEQYPNVARPSVEVVIATQASVVGDNVWRGGPAVRLVASGEGDRKHIEQALSRAFDELERSDA